LLRPEYIGIKLTDLPDEIIHQYQLKDKANKNGHIHLSITRGMYGLPQSGLLAITLLGKCLKKHGYVQSKFVPGLWKHKTRPVQFCLTVDDFGVKYIGKEHADHLLKVHEEHYKVTCDWSGTRYTGIHMHWDYDNHIKVHLFTPGYM
jgi:hypothetical protein